VETDICGEDALIFMAGSGTQMVIVESRWRFRTQCRISGHPFRAQYVPQVGSFNQRTFVRHPISKQCSTWNTKGSRYHAVPRGTNLPHCPNLRRCRFVHRKL